MNSVPKFGCIEQKVFDLFRRITVRLVVRFEMLIAS